MKFITHTLDYFDSLGIKLKNSFTYFFYSKSKLARFLLVYFFLIVLGYLILSRIELQYKWVYLLFAPPIIYFIQSLKRSLNDRAAERMELHKQKEIELANKLRGFNLKISDGRLKAIFRKLIKFQILDESNPENTEQSFINVFKKPFKSNNNSIHFLTSASDLRYFIDKMLKFESKNEKNITYKEIEFSDKFYYSKGPLGSNTLVRNYNRYKENIPQDFVKIISESLN